MGILCWFYKVSSVSIHYFNITQDEKLFKRPFWIRDPEFEPPLYNLHTLLNWFQENMLEICENAGSLGDGSLGNLKSENGLLSVAARKSSLTNKERYQRILSVLMSIVGQKDPIAVCKEYSTLILNMLPRITKQEVQERWLMTQ